MIILIRVAKEAGTIRKNAVQSVLAIIDISEKRFYELKSFEIPLEPLL